MRDPAAGTLTRLTRAMRRRCPRCDSPEAFTSFYELNDRCPGCGMRFEREPGYWVGAMIVITTLTFGLFLVLLVGGIVVTWPETPWNWLLGVTLAANLVIPVAIYPQAKLLWSAMELGWHPLEAHEIESAQRAVGGP